MGNHIKQKVRFTVQQATLHYILLKILSSSTVVINGLDHLGSLRAVSVMRQVLGYKSREVRWNIAKPKTFRDDELLGGFLAKI